MAPSEMTDEELRQQYNAAPKPNQYGQELLDRIHRIDREEFGMNADHLRGDRKQR